MPYLHRSPLRFAALTAVGGLLLCARASSAASLASDNAANPAYASGWLNGTNGGTGFGAWTFSNTQGGTTNSNNDGEFNGNSANNGGGNPNGTGGGIGNPAFGMYSGGANTASATRSFTGLLTVGQTFSLQVDNGYLSDGGTVGFNLLTTSGGNLTTANPRFGFFFLGGSGGYRVVGSTTQTTNFGFTDNGMGTTFTLTGANTFAFSVTFNTGGAGTTETFTGTLGGTAGSSIAGFQLFSTNVGTGGQNDVYFNTPVVAPEPSTWAAILLGGALLVAVQRRARPAN